MDDVLLQHEAALGDFADHFPLLMKFALKASEACRLMALLSEMGVSGAAIFPGLDGVVAALKEERFH
jgi:hypothetical protein